MRLDKYLKVSRIIKRRTVANEACDAGRVLVNGKAARASYDVKVGDIIEISFGTRLFKAEVTDVSETVRKDDAASLYKMLMYGKEASNRKQEIDRQHYTIPNQRPKDKHCGKI